MRELHVEVRLWKGVWSPLGDDSSAIWIPGRDGDRAAYSRWWCRLVVGTPPLCSRETCSATRLQMRTPGSSFAFSSSLIFFLTTRGALRPYQAWQARAYMTAASSSVKCMVSTEKSSGLRSPPCLPTDRQTMAARIRRLLYSKALLAAPQPSGWGGTSESRARRLHGLPGAGFGPWVCGKVHTGVTRGSVQFIVPFREPEKNPVVDLALSRANTADWLCARRFPGDCASMTRRFIILRAVPQSSLRHTCHLHHRDGDRYSAGPPDRAISYGRTSEPAS